MTLQSSLFYDLFDPNENQSTHLIYTSILPPLQSMWGQQFKLGQTDKQFHQDDTPRPAEKCEKCESFEVKPNIFPKQPFCTVHSYSNVSKLLLMYLLFR